LGVFDCGRKIFDRAGLRGLYCGFGVSLSGVVLYRATQFGCFDTGKMFIGSDEWVLKTASLATGSTLVAGFLTYGKDTVRRRLMMQSGRDLDKKNYDGGVHAYRKIWKKEGVYGFYRGGLANVIRGLGSSMCLLLYEELQYYVRTGHCHTMNHFMNH
jgi:solute carrier family 25 (adenine nucleotide translocator) protein 4/5/6/31